ncbi:MAG: type II secretion system F family protein [Candidatus Nomurabacteria bacterium]|jgi:type IV pilus assembly protein PilC|nr:type II secretion system F family protein [Candidatus Nomurabacteria bacterium]
MRRYVYTARETATDKKVKSVVQAESETAAGKLLIERGLAPISIHEEEDSFLKKFNSHVATKDKIVFTRQLATLIGAGLPLTQSLHTVLDQIQSKPFKAIIEDVTSSVESGKTLGESFGKHPEVFDKVYLALVSAGEVSGTLDDALKRVANQQEKDAAMMSKIRGAMTYPIIVVVVIFLVIGFMLFTVVPQVETLYEDLGEELPFLTRMMVDMANFIMSPGVIILVAVVVGLVVGFKQYIKTEGGIKFKDTFKLNVPLFGQLFRKLYMARFTRTAQTLLSTGVAMLDTLHISGEAANNTVVQQSIENAADKVKGGKPLSTAIKDQEYILPLVPQMSKIGEQSGKMDEMMGKAAQVYEDEVDEQIRTISTLIEPILMVLLAVMAGGMIGAILFPIYGLVNSV